MSVSRPNQRRLALALGFIAIATIVACDHNPTQPSPLTRLQKKPAAIDGDTLHCAYGWIVVNGAYVCNEES